MRSLLRAVVVAGLASAPAWASDGQIEINQAVALAGGVNGDLVLDPPGYPVTITQSGSYRITGHMTVPNANTDGIVVTGLRTSIDFGGFELRGPNQIAAAGAACTAAGIGPGVRSTQSVHVRGGRVSGMGSVGLLLGPASRVEQMTLSENCLDGALLGSASLVIDSEGRLNGGAGFEVGSASRVRDSIADANGIDGGIVAGTRSVVTGSIATANLGGGISVGAGSVVSENVAAGNGTFGIAANGGRNTVVHNTSHANGDVGIFSSSTNGVGGNTVDDNGIPGLQGTRIHCNLVDGALACP